MIDNKKEQEREALYRAIWNMANDLRDSVDGWAVGFRQNISESTKGWPKAVNHILWNGAASKYDS